MTTTTYEPPSSSFTLPDPTFTTQDISNLGSLDLIGKGLTELTKTDTLRYVLYSEPNWDIFIQKKVIAAEYTQYETGSYDGFCLYWLIKFNNLVADQDSIGFELALPNTASSQKTKDRTGFKFVYDATNKNYTSYSYYVNYSVDATPVTSFDHKWLCQAISDPNNG